MVGLAWDTESQASAPRARTVHASPDSSLTLTAEQVANAADDRRTSRRDRGLPERAVVIALATAQQESRLRNLDYGDRDSLGLFQQRPSQGWGTEAQVQDPVYAAGKFYDGLVKVPELGDRPAHRRRSVRAASADFPRLTSSGRRWRRKLTAALASDRGRLPVPAPSPILRALHAVPRSGGIRRSPPPGAGVDEPHDVAPNRPQS